MNKKYQKKTKNSVSESQIDEWNCECHRWAIFKSETVHDWIVDCTYELTVWRPAASLYQVLVDLPVI